MKRLALVCLLLAALSGCTSPSNEPAPKPEPTELQTGRGAFQRLYVAARGGHQTCARTSCNPG